MKNCGAGKEHVNKMPNHVWVGSLDKDSSCSVLKGESGGERIKIIVLCHY